MARQDASSVYQAVRTYRVLRQLPIVDFSGGWNPHAIPSELSDNESADMLNITYDEQSGLMKRLGYMPAVTGLNAPPVTLFYWPTAKLMIAQCGVNLVNLSNGATIRTFSDAQKAGFGDFQGKLIVVHPVDGVLIYDGGSWTNGQSVLAYDVNHVPTSTGPSPRGGVLAIWQNKVWISADPGAPSRVWASEAGNPSNWYILDYIDMREKDNEPVTALRAAPGMDDVGRPGLMVFKKNWWGRINDPRSGDTFGTYTALHNSAGASGREAVSSASNGAICAINDRGIWVSDGVSAPAYASAKIEHLFNSQEVNLGASHLWSAGQYRDRIVFCLTRGASQATNNFMVEYHPQLGWFVPHSIGFSSLASYLKDDYVLFGGSPTDNRVFQVFKGWADDGLDISAHYTTRWFAPGSGFQARMRHLRVDARGSFDLYTRGDYNDIDPGIRNQFSDTDYKSVWGNNNFQSYNDFYSLKVAKTVSWQVRETSQTPAHGRKLLQDGSQQEIGSFALYGLFLDFVRLGYA